MADGVTIHGGKSAAEIAYTLLVQVADVEGKWTGNSFRDSADRKYLLDTYAECLKAASGRRTLKGQLDTL